MVFELPAGTDTPVDLAFFGHPNGWFPYAGLIADADGNLYGTTGSGGQTNHGTVFKVDAGTHIPEPSTLALLALSFPLVFGIVRRR